MRPFEILGLIFFCGRMHHEFVFEVVNVISCSPFMFENTENIPLIGGQCFRGHFAIKTVVEFLRKNPFEKVSDYLSLISIFSTEQDMSN